MMKELNVLVIFYVLLWAPHLLAEEPASGSSVDQSITRGPETPEQRDARMDWWRDAKFGLFIHWGLYAIPADGEWHMRSKQMPLAEYKKYATEFNPIKFNADEWASLAEEAGMKYMVYTTKHHDGFAMYSSRVSDYNITEATPFKRDPLKELSIACPKYGVKLGVYYSVIADWGHPGGGAGCEKWDEAQKGDLDTYINQVSVPQVKELLSNYGPISVMWFDSDGAWAPNAQEVGDRYASVLNLQPDLIVRAGAGSYPGDFEGRESHIAIKTPTWDWELCYTSNGSWGYTKQPARSFEELLPTLIEAWGKGGDVLLNVGPDREGLIPADSAALLRQVGTWLKINGEAVYGSRSGPFDYLPWGWATRKEDMLYLFVLKWPQGGELKIPMETPITTAWLLSDSSEILKSKIVKGATYLSVPNQAVDPVATVIACKMSGEVPRYRSLSVEGPVTASEKVQSAREMVVGGWGMWGIESERGWIELDFGRFKTFSTVRLTTPSCRFAAKDPMLCTKGSRIILEVKNGGLWEKILEADLPMNGKNREGLLLRNFEPVTARFVRVKFIAGEPEVDEVSQIRVRNLELF